MGSSAYAFGSPAGSGFQFIFAGLPESVEYYVEAGPLDSKHFNVRVLDLPNVKNVRVTYRYPSWTHMQNVTEERGGDLRAVEGTEADLEVQTDKPMRDGLLVLDDEKQIRLSGGEGNVYKGTVRMEKDGVYHVAALDQGQPVRLSNDFFIEARKAEPPNVIIARPGHDYRASPIEEVTVAVKADDEFGVSEMTLHYSVNGGPEQTIDLLKQKGAKQADGSTILSLEDFKAVPGDVVSLYAIAKDAHSESRTDISFIQADPAFEREFFAIPGCRQAEVVGGGRRRQCAIRTTSPSAKKKSSLKPTRKQLRATRKRPPSRTRPTPQISLRRAGEARRAGTIACGPHAKPRIVPGKPGIQQLS